MTFFMVGILLVFLFGGSFVHRVLKGANVLYVPVFSASTSLLDNIASLFGFLAPKAALIKENEALKKLVEDQTILLARYRLLEAENVKLKKLSQVASSSQNIIAGVVRLPGSSPYDTLLIDKGEDAGLSPGDSVYTESDIPVGVVSVLYKRSALVKLYSSPGDTYDVYIGAKKISGKAYGRGGGNFEVTLPHGTEVALHDLVTLPGISSKTFGTIESMTDKESGTFVQALFKSPFSFDDLRLVVIRK